MAFLPTFKKLLQVTPCALFLTLLDSEDWFLPELQPTLQVEYISACSQLQNYSIQKRKKPKQS